MEKIKLPKVVAEAIEHLKRHHGGNDTLLAGVLGNANGSCVVTIREYTNKVGFDALLEALVNGYEVERTPEVIISEEYLSQLGNPDKWCVGFQEGIKFTLNALNVKIDGVNA